VHRAQSGSRDISFVLVCNPAGAKAIRAAHSVNAFHEGLKKAGLIEGQNCAIEYRGDDNQPDRLPALIVRAQGIGASCNCQPAPWLIPIRCRPELRSRSEQSRSVAATMHVDDLAALNNQS